MKKRCPQCKQLKLTGDFSKRNNRSCGLQPQCKHCDSKRSKAYSKQPEIQMRLQQYRRQRGQLLKQKALQRVGPVYCLLCGCSELSFLTVDHINNNGNKHRKLLGGLIGSKIYRWVLKVTDQELTKWNLRILCFNCNCAHLTDKEIKLVIRKEHKRIRKDKN